MTMARRKINEEEGKEGRDEDDKEGYEGKKNIIVVL